MLARQSRDDGKTHVDGRGAPSTRPKARPLDHAPAHPPTRQPSEAIESAIEEFKSQGVDLTGIYTGTGLQSHAVFTLSSQLQAHIDKKDVVSVGLSLESLLEEVQKEDEEVATAVLLAAETMHAFAPGVVALQGPSATTTCAAFLAVYAKLLLLSNTLREAFRGSPEADNVGAVRSLLAHEDTLVRCGALAVAGSLAVQDEAGKTIIMSMDPHEHIVGVLEATRGSDGDTFGRGVEAATALIVPLASADDTTQPSSSAFANARKLAQSGVSAALVESLRVLWNEAEKDNENANEIGNKRVATVTCQLCTGIKLLAANDEICKELVQELALLDLLFVVLKSSLADDVSAGVMASAMALLRQMMASDHVKHALHTAAFISIASNNLQMYIDETYAPAADPGNKVLEHTLGAVSALCLRNPEASESVVDSGCAQLIISAMQVAIDRKDAETAGATVATGAPAPAVGKPLRQGCMAVRNIASRSPHVREVLRSYEAVRVIENCKVAAKSACTDVGDAAIRDVTN